MVSPAGFPDFGVAYGDGIVASLRAHPARVALLPPFLASYARAARARREGADLVHAHWLPSGLAALSTRLPYVLQAWGHRPRSGGTHAAPVPPGHSPSPSRGRPVDRRRQAVTQLGASDVRVIGAGVDLPDALAGPAEPRTSSMSDGCPRRKASRSWRRRRTTSRAWSSVTDRCATSFRMRSGSCRRQSSATTTTAPRSPSAHRREGRRRRPRGDGARPTCRRIGGRRAARRRGARADGPAGAARRRGAVANRDRAPASGPNAACAARRGRAGASERAILVGSRDVGGARVYAAAVER